jgi:uncharacterized protein YbjQ (UPF0145 family)
VIISTTENIPGRTIRRFFGVVSGSTVRSKHIGRDIMAGIKNIFGGELTATPSSSRRAARTRSRGWSRRPRASARTPW